MKAKILLKLGLEKKINITKRKSLKNCMVWFVDV